MTTFILADQLFEICDMTLVIASGSEPFHDLCGVLAHVRDGMNRDIGCDIAVLSGAGSCVISHVGNGNDP